MFDNQLTPLRQLQPNHSKTHTTPRSVRNVVAREEESDTHFVLVPYLNLPKSSGISLEDESAEREVEFMLSLIFNAECRVWQIRQKCHRNVTSPVTEKTASTLCRTSLYYLQLKANKKYLSLWTSQAMLISAIDCGSILLPSALPSLSY